MAKSSGAKGAKKADKTAGSKRAAAEKAKKKPGSKPRQKSAPKRRVDKREAKAAAKAVKAAKTEAVRVAERVAAEIVVTELDRTLHLDGPTRSERIGDLLIASAAPLDLAGISTSDTPGVESRQAAEAEDRVARRRLGH